MSADDVDIRGRWKARMSGRVVDAYITPEQPYVDANVCTQLCLGAPIAYELHPEVQCIVTAD